MSLAAAFRFIERAPRDPELRDRLNHAAGAPERGSILQEVRCDCTMDEFEEAWRVLQVKCQSFEEADLLNELRLWWLFLSHT